MLITGKEFCFEFANVILHVDENPFEVKLMANNILIRKYPNRNLAIKELEE